MSGTSPATGSLDRLEALLDRRTPISTITALSQAISKTTQTQVPLETAAIGIDASVFLKLASHPKRDDIVDYLDTKHVGPLIVPGQAIQEFWNNQLAAVLTVSDGLKRKFEALKQEAEKLNPDFGGYAVKMDRLLDEFGSDYGYAYDPATLRSTLTIVKLFERKGYLSYVPRTRFHQIAVGRKRTKTPPGFKDDGDGDFFTWAEFLFGLLVAQEKGPRFDHAIVLTNDRKIDWSRDGIAHPVLTAEVAQLAGVPFDVWTIDQLARQVSGAAPIEVEISANPAAGP